MSRLRVHERNEPTDVGPITTKCGRSRPSLREIFENRHVRYTMLKTTTYKPAVTCRDCKES